MNWRDNKLKILIFVLILIFYGSLLIHKISFPTDDLGRHLMNGKMILSGQFEIITKNFYSYTEPDASYVNDHWLSGVIFYLIYVFWGFNGLIIFTTVVLLLAFALIFYAALKRADFWLVVALSIPVILILQERTDARPEIFSYLFIAIFIYLLFDLEEHSERNHVFWLAPLQLLWVNLHTFFIVGPALIGGFLFEKIILNRKNFRGNLMIKKLTMLFAAIAGVSFLNPNGISGALRPIMRFFGERIWVSEDQPLFYVLKIKPVEDISALVAVPLFFIALASFLFCWRRRPKPIFNVLAVIGTIVGGIAIIRTLPFFGLIFLPVVSGNLNGAFLDIRDRLRQMRPIIVRYIRFIASGAMIGVLLLLLFLGIFGKISKFNEFGLGLIPRSNDAAIFFKEQNLHSPIFNDPAIGSYLIWHLFPREKVFIDNRHADAYSTSLINAYWLAVSSEEAWRKLLELEKFNSIIFFPYDDIFNARQFLARRMQDPDWAVVYADNNVVILLRNNKDNQEKIDKFRITKDNVEEKMKYLLESQDVDDWIAAADIFNLMGRRDLALETFQQVVLKQPKNSKIWRIMGETAVLRNSEKNDVLAVIYLERAIELGQKNADAYAWLGLAQFRLGRFEESKEALQKSLELEPGRYDTTNYLNKLQQYLNAKKQN